MVNKFDDLPRILHVDDDEDIRDLVKIALGDVGGLEITQFSSGAETLENTDRINADLFLFDVMMPEMSGPETLKKLRAFPEFVSIPAVFLTAIALDTTIDLHMPGVVSVMAKPFDPMTLADELIQAWRSYLSDGD